MWMNVFNCETALHSAIRNFAGDISPIKILLEHDDNDINVGNLEDDTPLHLAVRNRLCPRTLLELLLQHGADVNVVNCNGDTPLHLGVAAVRNLTDYGVRNVVLVEHGANVNVVNRINGDTPLHLAAQNERDAGSGISFLLEPEHGTDVNIGNFNGDTPLHLYLQNKALRFYDMRTFLKNVRDVNAANSKGETPLHFAVRNEACCKVEYIKALLEFGADVSRKDAQGENAYQAYCHALQDKDSRRADPMLLILLQPTELQQRMDSSLHVACLSHNVDAVHNLLRLGADLNATDNFSFPPLFYALVAAGDADKDKGSTIRLMLDHGADFNHTVGYFIHEDSILDIGINGTFTLAGSENVWSVAKIFFEHLAKLFTLRDIQVERGIINVQEVLNERNRNGIGQYFRIVMDDIRMTEYNEWLSRCSEELKAMTKIKIGQSGVSFLDLLLASARETAICAKNKELVKAFQENKSKFPIYQGMLDAKLAKDLERRKLIESAAVVLSNALNFAEPSDEFFEITLSYCSNQDLIHVIAME